LPILKDLAIFTDPEGAINTLKLYDVVLLLDYTRDRCRHLRQRESEFLQLVGGVFGIVA
jgi:hypothetical protein